jgi:uncharacterized membrane protein
MSPKRWWGRLALILSLAGLGDSTYLTIDHFTGKAPICSASAITDCLKVTTSAQSRFVGIPVVLLGLAFFAAMLVLNWPALWQSASKLLARLRLVAAAGGIVFVLYLVSAELFVIKSICLWCTGVHVVTFALFVLIASTWPALEASGAGAEQTPDSERLSHEAIDGRVER